MSPEVEGILLTIAIQLGGMILMFPIFTYCIYRRGWSVGTGMMCTVFWMFVVPVLLLVGVAFVLGQVLTGMFWVLEFIFRQTARLYGKPVPPSELMQEPVSHHDDLFDELKRRRREAIRQQEALARAAVKVPPPPPPPINVKKNNQVH